jgi:hypothetical protein
MNWDIDFRLQCFQQCFFFNNVTSLRCRDLDADPPSMIASLYSIALFVERQLTKR